MYQGIEAVTTASLSLALDAASLRHQAIATNIANVNTPGYTPLAVSFEAQLEDAQRSMRTNGKIDPFTLAGVTLQLQPAEGGGAAALGVQLDTEVARMSQNALHYQALVKGLNKHLTLLAAAASEGKK